LALLVVPALILEGRTTEPEFQRIAVELNWLIWIAFCVHFLMAIAAEPTWGHCADGGLTSS
jgi:hypothetical protein